MAMSNMGSSIKPATKLVSRIVMHVSPYKVLAG